MLRRLIPIRNRPFARRPGARFIVITSASILMNGQPAVRGTWRPPDSRILLSDIVMRATSQPYHDLDAALAAWAKEEGARQASHPPLRHLAFTHATGLSGCLWHDGSEYVLAIKGAPEHVLARCDLTEGERERIIHQQHKFAAKGYRTVALARRTLAQPITAIGELAKKEPLEFAGLIALASAVRPNVRHSVSQAQKTGATLVLITGDHLEAAYYHGRMLGLARRRSHVLDARQLEIADRADFNDVRVFARAAPQHHEHIIALLRQRGQVATIKSPNEFHP